MARVPSAARSTMVARSARPRSVQRARVHASNIGVNDNTVA
jgi:hypothetical protein